MVRSKKPVEVVSIHSEAEEEEVSEISSLAIVEEEDLELVDDDASMVSTRRKTPKQRGTSSSTVPVPKQTPKSKTAPKTAAAEETNPSSKSKKSSTPSQNRQKQLAATTGQLADFPLLGMTKSHDPVFNASWVFHQRLICHKWKALVWMVRVKEAMDKSKTQWRRNPRWLAGQLLRSSLPFGVMWEYVFVPFEEPPDQLCSELREGQVQRLKKGIHHALRSLTLLSEVKGVRTDRRFCVMEVFGTSLSLYAADSPDWVAVEPVDLLTNVDLSSPQEQQRILEQIDELEPDLLVLTPPCGSWSCLQAINDQDVVVWKRLMVYHYWTFTRKAWDRQVKAGRLCITEQPWLSKALELKVMVQRPCLHRAIVDQCQFQLTDAVSHKPLRKRTVLDCSRASLAAALEEGARCTHQPDEHQPIEGVVKLGDQWVRRSSLLAGMWTREFCLHILAAASRALDSVEEPWYSPSLFVSPSDLDVIDATIGGTTCECCHSRHSPDDAMLVCAYCAGVVCHVCSSNHSCPAVTMWRPSVEDPSTGYLACVADVDPPPEHVVGDDEQQAEVALRKEFQRLQQGEDMRKGDFGGIGSRYGYIRFVGPALRLPKDVRNQLAKLHGNFAHPSNDRLARMLQINGASKAIIEGAKCIRCSVCERVSAPRSAPQASAKAPTRFNQQCSSDSFFVFDCAGSRWNITHVVDGFCSLQYAIASKNPCSDTSCELLFERWILVHGPMDMLFVDGGPEFKGRLEALCRLYAIHLEVLPVGSKWKAGLAERHGAVLKLMILRMIHELSVCTEKELRIAVAMACQAKNRLLRKCGRSPIQVTQGQDQVVPSSLLQQVADGEMKYSTNAAISSDEEINRMEQIRCAAISAFHWLDSHERLRVALNARSKPPKLVALTPGTQVYFHKPPGQHRRLQDNATGQQGPAVVAATEGVDKVWLRYKGTVVRVALENVRLATPEESLDTRYLTDVLRDMQQELTGERRTAGYEDLVEPPSEPSSESAVPSHVHPDRATSNDSLNQARLCRRIIFHRRS
eukprot:Skav208378  [mRNA]  locus=scaffold3508:51885:54965:+ [translate_table: standard]